MFNRISLISRRWSASHTFSISSEARWCFFKGREMLARIVRRNVRSWTTLLVMQGSVFSRWSSIFVVPVPTATQLPRDKGEKGCVRSAHELSPLLMRVGVHQRNYGSGLAIVSAHDHRWITLPFFSPLSATFSRMNAYPCIFSTYTYSTSSHVFALPIFYFILFFTMT